MERPLRAKEAPISGFSHGHAVTESPLSFYPAAAKAEALNKEASGALSSAPAQAGATSSSPGALVSAPRQVGAMDSSPDRLTTNEVSRVSADDLAIRVTAMVLAALESAKVNPSLAPAQPQAESQRSFTGTWNGQYGVWKTKGDGSWILVQSKEEMIGVTSSSPGQDPWTKGDRPMEEQLVEGRRGWSVEFNVRTR